VRSIQLVTSWLLFGVTAPPKVSERIMDEKRRTAYPSPW
jgi:hypothetical protein